MSHSSFRSQTMRKDCGGASFLSAQLVVAIFSSSMQNPGAVLKRQSLSGKLGLQQMLLAVLSCIATLGAGISQQMRHTDWGRRILRIS